MVEYQKKGRVIAALWMLLWMGTSVYGQLNGNVLVSGRIVGERQEPLSGVSVFLKGASQGVSTDSAGQFKLVVNRNFPFRLVFTSIGYAPQEIEIKSTSSPLAIQLVSQTLLSNEVVVTASRSSERLLQSPVTIEKLDIRSLKESPAPTFYDALANVKGVQLLTSSITFKVPNTRGFNIPNNFRFKQMVDGVDMQAATLGVPLGNAIGPTELDIQSVEITPGASSALYGMNAINGMANLITRSPFANPGLSVYQKIGVNHVDGIDRAPSLLTETALRYAKVWNNRWAFKVNVSYFRATDWVSNSRVDQNPNTFNTANPQYPQLAGGNNPAADLWNRYGDENNNAVTISNVPFQGGNRTFLVRRTGYWERDLVNPIADNLKADVALHYRITPRDEISYSYRIGKMDGIFQRGNKIQLDDVVVQNHKLEYKGRDVVARVYYSSEGTGNSYNLKPLADNLQLTHLSNGAWGTRFRNQLIQSLQAGLPLEQAMQQARATADVGRVEPGTPAFDRLLDTIRSINNWDHVNAGVAGAPRTGGAFLRQQSRMYHGELQWDLTRYVRWVNLLVGLDYRLFDIIPDGNNFVDFSRPVTERNQPLSDGSFGRLVQYRKYGGFVQASRSFWDDKLKLTGSIRIDRNPFFPTRFNPRIAAVYSPIKSHFLRVSYQNGFRFPSLFEALSFVNNGNVRRVGGLPFINEGLGYLENSYSLASVNAFNAAVNRDVSNGSSVNDAALRNRNLLEITRLDPTRPERIRSFEIGYKMALLESRMNIDVDFYSNEYDGFLGQVEVAVPSSGTVGSDASVIDMVQANRSRQTRYRVFTNAKNTYRNYGAAIGASYRFRKGWSVSGNFNFNDIRSNRAADIFLTAFNTARFNSNLSVGHPNVYRQIGFNVVWRWQDAFLWESPLAVGSVPAYHTVDAQITCRVPKYKTTIKLGATNLLNHRFIQFAAGPTIGGLYYVAITSEGLLP